MRGAILVVEDEPAIQELIAVNLQHAGHHVMRAGDAEGALGIVRNALPDLLLIDWMLPGMSGVSLAASTCSNPVCAAARSPVSSASTAAPSSGAAPSSSVVSPRAGSAARRSGAAV